MKNKSLRYFALQLFIILSINVQGQKEIKNDSLPFQDITDYPNSYSSENIVARMIDGLGFRFFWATEGLTDADLSFRPNPDARSSDDTIDHILGLSGMIINTIKNKPNLTSGDETSPKTFSEKRKSVLINLFEARQLLATSVKVEDVKIVFVRNNIRTELPVWNLINGPIADAIWHTGQIASFRRASGNPFSAKVNLMMGKLR
ncbi:MAG: hypothetical protein IPK35_04565 [Saprospiraceae bacterium]|nr:hypothetical protein [Saprospiraceae bacterium]